MLKRRMRYRAYIGLGSNLASGAGDSAQTVQAAEQALGKLGSVVARSSLYRTSPVGYRDQPDFINAAVCMETELEPERLLGEMLAVERRFGRDRSKSVPKGPRTVDLDLLLVLDDDGMAIVCELPGLTLPHSEMASRRFVLQPLAEIAPELRHPLLGRTTRELLQELPAGDGDSEVKGL
jgi:2-amino-4-hydroxy-6-hydroxymethyldihydropteridine diphosphokinase